MLSCQQPTFIIFQFTLRSCKYISIYLFLLIIIYNFWKGFWYFYLLFKVVFYCVSCFMVLKHSVKHLKYTLPTILYLMISTYRDDYVNPPQNIGLSLISISSHITDVIVLDSQCESPTSTECLSSLSKIFQNQYLWPQAVL